MNNIWSNYIQTTEELYHSRDRRFNDATKDLWLKAIGAKPGDNILEIGCAGGVFCHKLKKYVPDITISGIDLDISHIEFAKKKSVELGLSCEFINGDATAMPFVDNSFDLCYSHTVSEHIPHEPFFGEQYRVLKTGGRIVVLSVRSRMGIKNANQYIMSEDERELMEKAWSKAGNFDAEHNVGIYEIDEHKYPVELEKAGFHNVNVDIFSFVEYAPDNFSVLDDMAIEQINCNRMLSLTSVQKALNISPDALTDKERDKLINLINKRYDERIKQYKSGVKLWDFSTSTVLVVSGVK